MKLVKYTLNSNKNPLIWKCGKGAWEKIATCCSCILTIWFTHWLHWSSHIFTSNGTVRFIILFILGFRKMQTELKNGSLQSVRLIKNLGKNVARTPSKSSTVCEIHFEQRFMVPGNPSGRNRLTPRAVPTIFPALAECTVRVCTHFLFNIFLWTV